MSQKTFHYAVHGLCKWFVNLKWYLKSIIHRTHSKFQQKGVHESVVQKSCHKDRWGEHRTRTLDNTRGAHVIKKNSFRPRRPRQIFFGLSGGGNLWWKSRTLAKICNFGENLELWRKFWTLAKISNFAENLDLWWNYFPQASKFGVFMRGLPPFGLPYT